MIRLKTLLGQHRLAEPLRSGAVKSDRIRFEFADVKVPNTAFKRVVRDLEFDVAELAIVTYLMAKAQGVPLVLIPAVVVGRFQHPFVYFNAERGHLEPKDLEGRRLAIRSYTVTTVMWLRGILSHDFDVDFDRVSLVTFEDAHVAGFVDPAEVERAGPDQNMLEMLRCGDVDAAIMTGQIDDPAIKPLIPNAKSAAESWHARTGAIQVNHLMVAKSNLSKSDPETVREVYSKLLESKRAAGLPEPGTLDMNPFGFEANVRNLDIAIDYTYEQGLIPRRFAVEELFDDATRRL